MSARARTIVRFASAILLAAAFSALPATRLPAQNLGPFRQFLGLEGSYERLQLDNGDGKTVGLNGYGTRLWVNLAPFSGPGTHAVDKLSLALFYFRTPSGNVAIATRHYGAEVNIYPLLVPIAKAIDPFLSLGLGAFRIDNRSSGAGQPAGGVTTVDIPAGSATNFAISPGMGIRVPIPNRFQLRLDARDVLGLNMRTANGVSRTSQSWQLTGSIGLTF